MEKRLEQGRELARQFIKVSDEELRVILKTLSELSEIEGQYNKSDSSDIENLEKLKKQLNAKLEYMAGFYSKMKANDKLLEEIRKRIKARVVQELIDGGNNVTTSDKIVYNDKMYIGALEKITEINEFTEKINTLYWHYRNTLQLMVQTLSLYSTGS